MLRIIFKTKAKDYRPITWPLKHPYWCTGYGKDYSCLVAYADTSADIFDNWPEAYDLQQEEVDDYCFNSRFPRPAWFI